MKQFNNSYSQLLPLFFTAVTFFVLSILLFLYVHFLNLFPVQKIVLQLHPADILAGLIIYLKTSIDFVLFIGNLIHQHTGTKNRIAIELGTSLGNAIGTLFILTVWIFFKEVPLLLTIMIFIAALLLLRMAEEGLQQFSVSNFQFSIVKKFVEKLFRILRTVNKIFDPLLGKLLPRPTQQKTTQMTFWSLFLFALTIPFLLGLDDFAGYISLFSIINIVGFSLGVFLGHTLLTASLFAFPQKTAQFVRFPAMLFLGSVVFLGLSVWGFIEVGGQIFLLFR